MTDHLQPARCLRRVVKLSDTEPVRDIARQRDRHRFNAAPAARARLRPLPAPGAHTGGCAAAPSGGDCGVTTALSVRDVDATPSTGGTASTGLTEAAEGDVVARIAQLFEVAGRESDTMRRLDGCLDDLRQVHAARLALRAFTAEELRAALEYRHRVLSGRHA